MTGRGSLETIAVSLRNRQLEIAFTDNYPVIFPPRFLVVRGARTSGVHKKSRCSSVWSNGFEIVYSSRLTYSRANPDRVAKTSDHAVVPIARTTQHKLTQAGFLTCSLLSTPSRPSKDSGTLPKGFAFEVNAAGTHSGATVTDFNRVPFGYAAVKTLPDLDGFLNC